MQHWQGLCNATNSDLRYSYIFAFLLYLQPQEVPTTAQNPKRLAAHLILFDGSELVLSWI